jgi:hypothetical protein
LNTNPNVIRLFEKNINKINWIWLSMNNNIFELNYDYLKQRMDIFREELIMKAWHPTRVMKWIEDGLDMEDL